MHDICLIDLFITKDNCLLHAPRRNSRFSASAVNHEVRPPYETAKNVGRWIDTAHAKATYPHSQPLFKRLGPINSYTASWGVDSRQVTTA